MESKLPPEYLNNKLNEEEIKSNATDIWNEAFDQDWSGDLQLLPKDGLPSALTGLCKVKSGLMYDRLNNLRPDLAGITDSLKVFIHANHRYGYFTDFDYRPIIVLEDDDKLQTQHMMNKRGPGRKLEHLSGHLIHIAMRRYVLKIVRIKELTFLDFEMFMEDIGENGNLDLLKVINGAMITGQFAVLEYIQHRFGENDIFVEIFLYLRDFGEKSLFTTEHLDCWEWSVDICTNFSLSLVTVLAIKNREVAEKVVTKLGDHSINVEFLSLACQHVNMDTFNYLWTNRKEGVEDLVLGMFTIEDPDFQTVDAMGGNVILFLLIEGLIDSRVNNEDVGLFDLDMIRYYYEHHPPSRYLQQVMYSAAAHRNFQVVEYLRSKGVKPRNELFNRAIEAKELDIAQFVGYCLFGSLSESDFDIKTAAKHGNLETVKFLHRNCCGIATSNGSMPCSNAICVKNAQEAFLCAARKGDYEMVKYFVEQRREDCDLGMGLYEAVNRGSFKLARYFYGLGVGELKKNSAKAIQKWLGRVPPTSKLAEFVREHFVSGKQGPKNHGRRGAKK
ncbi:hypothetical protein HDU76_006302 [Blyttiomyces sp. JEL0837]|nr:hypothetical protein HDU76_006302 [Blyttiomyces sp. JEL0837]